MTEEMVRCVFGMDCRITTDPVSGTPMCVPMGRNSDDSGKLPQSNIVYLKMGAD